MDKRLSGVKNFGRAIYAEMNTGEKDVRLKNQLPGAIMPSCPVPSQKMKSRLDDMVNLSRLGDMVNLSRLGDMINLSRLGDMVNLSHLGDMVNFDWMLLD
jgi:hypothetical protein